MNHIDFVFDGPPGPQAPKLIEAVDAEGRSVQAGEWIERDDGRWVLRVHPEKLYAHAFRWASQVLQRLYDSEINCSLSSFWDGGWQVKLGDASNGFLAEATVGSLDDAAQWLHEQAHRHFPASEYARKFPLSG